MSSPIRRCSSKGKSIATTSDSDSSGSPLIRQKWSITLGGMNHPRPMSEDLAELNNNERSIVEFILEMEEQEASGQVPVDDPTHQIEPRSEQAVGPTAANDSVKDQTLAQKKIDYALADLLPMLILQTDPPAGFSFLIPAIHQRPWTPPTGYACVYESWFNNCSLWWPLPEFLTTYCSRRKIALGQYTANGIRILVTLTVLATELGIKMSAHLFEELTTPSITVKTGFFYGKMVPKYNVITGKPSKVDLWNHRYFYIKINEASFEDPSIILNGYFNANIDRLSKWSQSGSQSFLEEVEAIRTLSHQHWPDISEACIQATLNRINRAREFRDRPEIETTTRRLRESREHEVRKERIWVESSLKQQIAPVYDKIRQFVEEQPSIQSKLALYSEAKGTRESLEKIHRQGLSMDEILQQARADEVKYRDELQGM
ncbi:hypothetical protein N665_0592s0002 [Sinapis alba]|nr:hypothetical protein N665_0592s0002 [Sinapis alba]